MKKLIIHYELNITDENEGILDLLALHHGFSGTPEERDNFITMIINTDIRKYCKDRVSEAFDWYYGASQSNQKLGVLTLMDEKEICTSTIDDLESSSSSSVA